MLRRFNPSWSRARRSTPTRCVGSAGLLRPWHAPDALLWVEIAARSAAGSASGSCALLARMPMPLTADRGFWGRPAHALVPRPLQELALSSKPGLLAAIDELEKMTAGLKEALKEELTTAAAQAREAALAEAEAGALGLAVGGNGGSGSRRHACCAACFESTKHVQEGGAASFLGTAMHCMQEKLPLSLAARLLLLPCLPLLPCSTACSGSRGGVGSQE